MSRSTRRAARALPLSALGLALSFALPAAALADAPTITWAQAVTPEGVSTSIAPLGISPGAREVIANGATDDQPGFSQGLVYDTAAGTTRKLGLPAGDGPAQGIAEGVSKDLTRVLFASSLRLEASDTNDGPDQYVLDRPTGTYTLVSRALGTGAPLGAVSGARIGGDGTAVLYDDPSASSPRVLRYDLVTHAVTVVGPGVIVRDSTTDRAARVVVTSVGASTPAGTFPVPPNPSRYHDLRHFVASPDGSTVAFTSPENLGGFIGVLDTVTGARHDIPSEDVPSGTIVGVANGGTSVIIAADVARGTRGEIKEAIVRVALDGTVTQIGPDVPYAGSTSRTVITEDAAFAANATQISALGSAPLPAVAPGGNATDYVTLYPGCGPGGLFAPAVRPSVVLRKTALGTEPHTPVKADVTITRDSTGSISNKFTILAGQRHSLNAGYGGFHIVARVYFSDRTTATGVRAVATYRPVANSLTNTRNACKLLNGM